MWFLSDFVNMHTVSLLAQNPGDAIMLTSSLARHINLHKEPQK